mgnify:FL=1
MVKYISDRVAVMENGRIVELIWRQIAPEHWVLLTQRELDSLAAGK